MEFVWFLLLGLAAGAIAGWLTKGSGFGLVGNLIIGVLGAVVGGFVFGLLGFSANSLLAKLIAAVVGAIILLFALRLALKNKK